MILMENVIVLLIFTLFSYILIQSNNYGNITSKNSFDNNKKISDT